MSAKIGHRSAASSSTDAVARERAREDAREHEHEHREHAAERDREPDHPLARAVGLLAPASPELAPDDDLPRDRHGVEDEREEDPELERDLVRRDRGVAEARRDRAREDEREHQRGRPDEDPLPEREHTSRKREPDARLAGLEPPQHDDHERGAHPELRDRRPPRRARDPPVEAVDEEQLEEHVRDVAGDEDDERRAQVGDPAEVALRPECEERGREADRRRSAGTSRRSPPPLLLRP